jgi:hypothetical protein
MLYLRNTNQIQSLAQQVVRGPAGIPPAPPSSCSVLIPALTSSEASLKIWLDAGYTSSYTLGSTIWYDLTANGNNVSLSGSLSYDSCTGSIEFPGLTSSFAGTTTATNLDPGTGTMSSEVWYRIKNTAPETNYIFINQVGYMDAPGSVKMYSNQIANLTWNVGNPNRVISRFGTNNANQSTPSPAQSGSFANLTSVYDTWTQVVTVRDGDTLSNYVNGVFNSSNTGFAAVNPDNTNLLRLGLANPLDVDTQFETPFSGSISALKIWIGKALTATEVSASYAYMQGRYGV